MNTLESKIEEISDEFKSTFSKTSDPNILQNMIGTNEFDELREAILKHVPDAVLEFKQLSDWGERNMYLIIDKK